MDLELTQRSKVARWFPTGKPRRGQEAGWSDHCEQMCDEKGIYLLYLYTHVMYIIYISIQTWLLVSLSCKLVSNSGKSQVVRLPF